MNIENSSDKVLRQLKNISADKQQVFHKLQLVVAISNVTEKTDTTS